MDTDIVAPGPTKPVVDFDHHSPGYIAGAQDILRELRARGGPSWSPHYDGFWILTRYADVHAAIRDTETFSSERLDESMNAITIPMMPSPLQLPMESDGPDFQLTRRIATTAMSPKATAALQPAVDRWTARFLAEFEAAGGGDLIYDYAMPIPACVTLEWLGLPPEEWRSYAEPLHDAVSTVPGSERFMMAMVGLGEMILKLSEVMEARRVHPQDDVVSYVVGHERDGSLDHDKSLAVLFLMLAGGIDTTTSLTGSAFVHLARHAEDRARLIRSPGLFHTATEEFLRVYPSLKYVARTVKRPVEIGGQPMEPGDRALLSVISANYDEEAFPGAEEVRLDREENRHLTFAAGMHRCAGSHLARVMFKAMAGEFLARLPDYCIADEELEEYPDAGVVGGWASIPTRC